MERTDSSVAERKTFLLRLPAEMMDELNRWARDELRSVNAQIEYVLREALRQRGRMKDETRGDEADGESAGADGGAGE